MAEKRTIEVEVKDNVQTLKAQYKEAVKAMNEMVVKYGVMSEEAIAAAKHAGELKEQLQFSNKALKSFNPEAQFNAIRSSIGGVGEGIEVVNSSLQIMGVESGLVESALTKVGAAMQLSQSLQSLVEAKTSFKQLGLIISGFTQNLFKKNAATALSTELDIADTAATEAQAVATGELAVAQQGAAVATGVGTNAMKLFRIALISTGIGAIVVGIGLLIANFDKLAAGVMWAREKFEKLGTGAKILISVMFPIIGIIYGTIKALEYFGVVDDVQTAKAKKNAHDHTEAVIKGADKRANAIKKEQQQNDAKAQREIDIAKALGKATYEMELSKAKSHLASGRTFLEVQKTKMKAIKAEMDLLLESEDKDSDRYKALKKRTEAIRKIMDETYKDNVDTKHSIEVMEAEHRKEMADKNKDAADKAKQISDTNRKAYIDALKKQYEDELKLEEELENQKIALMQDGIEKEKAVRQDAFNDYRDNFLKERMSEEQAALDKQYQSGKISREQYNKEVENLRLTAETKLTDKEKEILTNAKELLNKDLLAIDKKYQEEKKKNEIAWQDWLKNQQAMQQKELEQQTELIAEENYQASLTAQNRELYLLEEKYAQMLLIAKEGSQEEKILLEAKRREQDDINKKYDKEEADRKEAAMQRDADLVKSGLQLISNITDMFTKKGQKESKKAFQIKKAASISTALIDTYLSAVSAYHSQFKPVSDASSPIRGGIAAGIAVAAGLTNVAKIASQKYEGGGSTGGGAEGGGGGLGGATQAPSFNVVGNNGLNQLSQLQQQPLQAYVVSGNVTTAQSLDRNRVQNATL